jgi:ribosome-associated protein
VGAADGTGTGTPEAARPGLVRVSPTLSVPEAELHLRFGPSGGPGGQHANKVATRVELRFDVAGSPSLTEWQRARLLQRVGPELRVVADEERSQLRNRRLAVERFRERVAAALVVERPRRPTRPGRGATERRLEEKRRQAERKQQRRPGWDE